ncbi:MAG TPA: putative 2OG-Fe(II) oxygenase [Wenzhouxiangellaceae bacterium]|nr:putative 2OG-Fe(II) oxygenase [Wenzhouxiangellaceae bacterium]
MPIPPQPDGRTYTLFPAVVRRCDFRVPELNEALYQWVKRQQADPAVANACDVRDVATVRGYQPDIVLHERLDELSWWQRFMSTVVHPTIQSWLVEHCRLSGWPRPGTGYGFKASWAVLYPAGAFQAPHFHPDTFCTLAYYPRVPSRPEPEGALRFVNPHLESTLTPTASWNYHQQFIPGAGTAIVFPGWLQHYSYPHQGDDERMLLTFDIKLLPPK